MAFLRAKEHEDSRQTPSHVVHVEDSEVGGVLVVASDPHTGSFVWRGVGPVHYQRWSCRYQLVAGEQSLKIPESLEWLLHRTVYYGRTVDNEWGWVGGN